MPRVVASIEARMGSSRLPGKVLADIGGKPALSHLLARLRRCKRLDEIVLATSVSPKDDALEAWAQGEGVACYRGSEDDVLARVVEAHRSVEGEIIVETHGDCPFLDPAIVDWGVETFLSNRCDVVHASMEPETFPQGQEIQVFRLHDLAEIARTVDDPEVREHVSLHFYRHPEHYRLYGLIAPPPWRGPDQRVLLDYPEDLTQLRALCDGLSTRYPQHDFSLEAIIAHLRAEG